MRNKSNIALPPLTTVVGATCPTVYPRLNALLDHELPPDEAVLVEGHLSACKACTGILRAIRELREAATAALPAPSPVDVSGAVLARIDAEASGPPWSRIAAILDEKRLLTPAQIKQMKTLPAWGDKGGWETIRQRLLDFGVSPVPVYAIQAEVEGVPFIDLLQFPPEPPALETMTGDMVRRLKTLPVHKEQQTLYVAMQNPRDTAAVDEIRFVTRCRVRPMAAVPADLQAAIDAAYPVEKTGEVPPRRLDFATAQSLANEYPIADLSRLSLDNKIVALLPAEAAARLRALPLHWERESLVVAMANPGDTAALDEVRRTVNAPVRALFAPDVAILEALIEAAYKTGAVAPFRMPLSPEMMAVRQKAIDALPNEYRVVLEMSLRENISYQEIAEQTGLSIPGVKTHLHRARNQVRLQMEAASAAAPPTDTAALLLDEIRALRGEMTAMRDEMDSLRRQVAAARVASRLPPRPATPPRLFPGPSALDLPGRRDR